MKYIFVLSGPNLELAKEEVLALAPAKFIFFKNFLLLDIKDKNQINFLAKRLAFTHEIYQIQPNAKKKIGKYPVKLIKKISKEYQKRKAHLRPQLHPSSLNPKLAKALINLTGIKKGSVLDPFCGSGGILIEAALMDLKPIGYDINEVMLRRAIINLTHYKIKKFELKLKDATKLKQKFDYVVTDLPYGKNTAVKDLNKLYLDFLKTLKKILKKKAVVCFPDFIDYKKLIKLLNSKNSKGLENSKNFQSKANLKVEKEFCYYIHKNLTKKIVVTKR